MGDEQQVVNGSPPPEGVEAKAREMGWRPKEDFQGNPETFVDAETFVRRGEELMPLLRANNRRLTDELTSTRAQLTEAQQMMKANQEAIEELKAFNAETSKERREDRKRELMGEIVAAREAGNVEREVGLTAELTRLDTPPSTERPKEKDVRTITPEAAEAAARQTPVWKEWAQDNAWFGQDRERTDYAEFVGAQLRREGNRDVGRAFLDAVAARVNKTFGATATVRDAPNRVEGARGGGSGANSGRTYADLPTEARAACDKQASRLVGPGRAFKDEAAWRKHYVSKYQWE